MSTRTIRRESEKKKGRKRRSTYQIIILEVDIKISETPPALVMLEINQTQIAAVAGEDGGENGDGVNQTDGCINWKVTRRLASRSSKVACAGICFLGVDSKSGGSIVLTLSLISCQIILVIYVASSEKLSVSVR